MNRSIELIKELNLQKHPEGGYFKENYRSEGVISESALPDEFNGNRNYCTGIYFLLTSDSFSAFHKIKQDEMWHFYEGSPLIVHMINETGKYSFQKIGLDIADHQLPQFVVPKNTWFASEVLQPNAYSFVGCTVSPGFYFEDFELAERNSLVAKFPACSEILNRLCR